MKLKYNNSLLEALPIEILHTVLSFFDEQEKVEVVQQLRLVSKNIKNKVTTEDFLKANAPFLFLKNQKNMRMLVTADVVNKKQIESWEKLKTKVIENFKPIFNNYSQIHVNEAIKLVKDIKNKRRSATSYFTGVCDCMSRCHNICILILLLSAMIFQFILATAVLIPLEEQRETRSELANLLLAENCTQDGETVSIYNCSDTVRANEWSDLDHEIWAKDFIVSCYSAFLWFFVLFITLVCGCYVHDRGGCSINLPQPYQDLSLSSLTPDHKTRFDMLQCSFSILRTYNYKTISDITGALEKIISEKEIPSNFYRDMQLNALAEQYTAIIKTLDKEIQKLKDYLKADKLIISDKMANGEFKSVFRGKVYTFFNECKKKSSNEISNNLSREVIELNEISKESNDDTLSMSIV